MVSWEWKILLIQAQMFISSNRCKGILSRERKILLTKRDIIVNFIVQINLDCIEYVKTHEVSNQIDFARAGVFNEARNDRNVVGMYPEWKSKRVSEVRFMDTH